MQIIVSGSSIHQAIITEESHQLVIQQPVTSVVELAIPGAQGPAFVGQQYFNMASNETLTIAESGVTLRWNGSQFVPASELSDGLTIFGGSF